MNYQKAPVIDCRSVRPAAVDSEIPTGIEIRQSLGSQLLAYLVPVVKTIDKEVREYTLMCCNIGTHKTINFPFGTNGKLMVLGVSIHKHFRHFGLMSGRHWLDFATHGS